MRGNFVPASLLPATTPLLPFSQRDVRARSPICVWAEREWGGKPKGRREEAGLWGLGPNQQVPSPSLLLTRRREGRGVERAVAGRARQKTPRGGGS